MMIDDDAVDGCQQNPAPPTGWFFNSMNHGMFTTGQLVHWDFAGPSTVAMENNHL